MNILLTPMFLTPSFSGTIYPTTIRYFIFVLFFLALIPALSSAGSYDLVHSEHAAIAGAQEAMQKNDLDKAESILTDYLGGREKEVSATFYLVLGNCYYQQQKMKKARQNYGQGLKLSPERDTLHLNYAAACYSLKLFREAGQHFLKGYKLQDKPETELLYRAAVSFYQGKLYTDCEKVLQDLLKQAKKIRTEWIEILTYAYMQQNKWSLARKTLMDLLQQSPVRQDYWKLLAQIHLRGKNYQSAAGALEIAYSIEPPASSEWKELADIYSYIDAPLKAAETLHIAYGNPLKTEECLEIARLYARGFCFQKALDLLDKALEKNPSAGLYLEKGRLCYKFGRYKKAKQALDESLELSGRNGEAYLWMGYAASQLRDWDLAQKAFSRAENFSSIKNQARSGLQSVQSILKAKQSIPPTGRSNL